MEYFFQTVRLLNMMKDCHSTNILRHFFAEVQQLRDLYSFALINAITIAKSRSYISVENLIKESITRESYMMHIALIDLRNLIVFIVRKDCNTVIQTEPFLHPHENDSEFLALHKASSISAFHINKLRKLIETCYYISHIHTIIFHPHTIKQETWTTCHEYFKSTPLTKSLRHTYTLLKPLIYCD